MSKFSQSSLIGKARLRFVFSLIINNQVPNLSTTAPDFILLSKMAPRYQLNSLKFFLAYYGYGHEREILHCCWIFHFCFQDKFPMKNFTDVCENKNV